MAFFGSKKRQHRKNLQAVDGSSIAQRDVHKSTDSIDVCCRGSEFARCDCARVENTVLLEGYGRIDFKAQIQANWPATCSIKTERAAREDIGQDLLRAFARCLSAHQFSCLAAWTPHREGSVGRLRAAGRGKLSRVVHEHSTWQTFVNKAEKALLETPEGRWDERWLGDLHLFNLVVRDANQSAMHSQEPILTDLSGLFTELVQRQKDSLAKLLGAYAAQDAAAAFRTAEVCGLDLPVAFPEVIVKNCDQPPFLALITEQSNREAGRGSTWASLMAEAGLRSRVVAEALQDLPPASEWDSLVSHLPRYKLWFLDHVIAKSYYTQIITIAAGKDTDQPSLPFLSVLTNVPAPGSRWLSNTFDTWMRNILMGTIFASLLLLGVNAALINLDYYHYAPLTFLTIYNVVAVPSMFGLFLVQNRQRSRRRAYKFILNLSSDFERSGMPDVLSPVDGRSPFLLRLATILELNPIELLSRLVGLTKAPRELRRALLNLKALRDHPSIAESSGSIGEALRQYAKVAGSR